MQDFTSFLFSVVCSVRPHPHKISHMLFFFSSYPRKFFENLHPTLIIFDSHTVSIGADPHYSVFLPTQQLLCYSVHGKKGHIFNLISNKKMVINALFIPDARREEVTWIGEIGIVIRDFKSGVEVNPTKLSFHASNKSLNIDGQTTLKAAKIKGITISNGKKHISETMEATMPGQQPEVRVALIDAGLNFTIKFLTEHLDMIWEGTHKQPTDSHGLIGKY